MRAKVGGRLFPGLENEQVHLIGPYTVGEQIGSGGMGVVYSAWDPKLERALAIKVLSSRRAGAEGENGKRERARLTREAQALAKVSHPNVVHVYEVGEHEGDLFIAMELVEGAPLHKWQEKKPRTVRQILEVYLQAGEGLAAAHEVGLVHRDFKPSNVLLGDNGRVRVLDFGLAQGPGLTASSKSTVSAPHPSVPKERVTKTGTVSGTPAYMAPEQFTGREPDASADQFSFCMSVYEGLVGCRPFETAVLRRAARDGLPPPAKGDRSLPWTVARVLRRGLSAQPQRRWPNMHALLRALRSALRWRIARWWVLGPIALGLAGAGLAKVATEPSCDPAPGTPAKVWASDVPTRIKDAMVSVGKPYADDAWVLTKDRLGTFVGGWTRAYRATCRANEDDRRHRSDVCLADAATSFDAVIEKLEEGEELGVVNAGPILDQLMKPGPCASAEPPALTASISKEQFEAFTEAKVNSAAGDYQLALEQLEPLIGALPESDLRSQTLTLLGQMQAKRAMMSEARETLAQAAGQSTEETRVRALLALIEVLLELERYESAEDYLNQAESVLSSASHDVRADYFDLWGKYQLHSLEDPEAAADAHQRALHLRTDQRVSDPSRVATTKQLLAHALAASGQTDEATELYRDIERYRARTVGEHHPLYAEALFNLGVHAADDAKFLEARAFLESALKVVSAAEGEDSTFTARIKAKLAESLLEVGEEERALTMAREAWETQRAELPSKHSDYRASLTALASVEQHHKRWKDSLTHHLLLHEIVRGTKDENPLVVHNLAYLSCMAGQCDKAPPYIEATKAFLESLPPEIRQTTQLQLLALFSRHTELMVEIEAGSQTRAIELAKEIRQAADELVIEPGDEENKEYLDDLEREFRPLEAQLGLRP